MEPTRRCAQVLLFFTHEGAGYASRAGTRRKECVVKDYRTFVRRCLMVVEHSRSRPFIRWDVPLCAAFPKPHIPRRCITPRVLLETFVSTSQPATELTSLKKTESEACANNALFLILCNGMAHVRAVRTRHARANRESFQ